MQRLSVSLPLLLFAPVLWAQTTFVEITPTTDPYFNTKPNEDFWVNAVAPADYDGDGRIDLAVYRPATGAWFIAGSAGGNSQQYWGNGTTDVALPLPYAVRHTFFP